MTKFILITQQTTANNEHQIFPVAQFDNINEAESSFHSQLASAMISETIIDFTATVMDTKGNVMLNRAWVKPIEPAVVSE
jgi:hypothetical protein